MSSAVILGDWGTSRLRLFRMDGDKVAARAEGPGIGALDGPAVVALRAALAELIAPGAEARIILCGMAGSRNGLVEAPYAECPAGLAEWRYQAARTVVDGAEVRVLPGLACVTPAGAPDVMRGEETQIFGAMALDPALAQGRHVIALPGTHCKWAVVEDGKVAGFQTWFTGELYALLAQHSTLARAGTDEGGREEGFQAGLERAASDPDLSGALFTARAAQLREGRSHGWALGYLSGLLIGQEIGAASQGEAVTLVGAPALTNAYVRAMAARGITSRVLDGEQCALAGLQLHGNAA
jgi:2-dehydro-3-deoxygalactonokinase